MDSNQSANNKRSFDAISLQTQDDDVNMPSLIEEDGGTAKRFKDEQLDPLKIESILEKVFSNLDVNSIKNARQVNPVWSIEGAKMLITKYYLKIPSNLQASEASRNSKDMEEFTKFLSHKSSYRSMIPNITIDKVGDIELWKSLRVLGHQVESLKLNIIDDNAEMLQTLLNLLPNLKYLHTTKSDSFWYKRELVIKALNSVMFSPMKEKSPLVISFMNLYAGNLEELENIEKFAECNNILIEELKCEISPYFFPSVPNLGIRISNLMGKLLSRSRNILKSLTLKNCTSFLPLLEFPKVSALTHLEIISAYQVHVPMKFSPTFRFSENVPNLVHFKFTGPDSQPPFFGQLFEQTETVPSVKILEVDHRSDDIDIDSLLQTFPNVEEYETDGPTHSQKMFESIWKYGSNLRKLIINIQDTCGYPVDIGGLDSFITGFTRETVDKIKKTPNLAPYPLEEMEQLRVNPSILDLKHLEHLEITFLNFDQRDVSWRFMLTAGEYAFKLMPKETKIFLTFMYGYFGCEDGRNSLLDEVSKLPNVTGKFEHVRWYESASEEESE